MIEKNRTNRKIDILNCLITKVRFDNRKTKTKNRNMRYPGYF